MPTCLLNRGLCYSIKVDQQQRGPPSQSSEVATPRAFATFYFLLSPVSKFSLVFFVLVISVLFCWQPYVDIVSLSLGREGWSFLGNSLALGIFSGPVGAPFFLELRMWKIPLAVGSEVGQILIESKGLVLPLESSVTVIPSIGSLVTEGMLTCQFSRSFGDRM